MRKHKTRMSHELQSATFAQVMKFRFNNIALANQVMEDGDPQGAIREILAVTSNDRPMRISAAFDAVRTRILKTDKYKREEGYLEMQQLLQIPTITDDDKTHLKEVLRSPLRTIRWAQNLASCVFHDPVLAERFKRIQIVKDPFYEFVMPANIVAAIKMDRSRRTEENHSHKTHKVEAYHFTNTEIDDMIQIAMEWCKSDRDWTKRCHSHRLLECLGLLTGRRKWELCSTLKIRSVQESDFQAEVRGIGKKLFDTQWRRIPLLAPIDVVIAGISRIRRYAHEQGTYNSGAKLFPKLTHTRYRDIYTRRAFENRAINKFHPESCSELWWRSQALCNSLSEFTKHYTTLIIDEPTPEPVIAVDGTAPMADSAC